VGAFSAKFSMTLADKLLMGPKNFLDLQCWHGPPLYHAKFGGNRTTYSAWEDEVWCFSLCLYFLKITLSAFDYFGAYSWVTSTRHIAPAFVGQFRWCLHHSFSDEKHFPAYRTVFKIVARWRYDWCPKGRTKWKSEKMGEKVVSTTSTIYKRGERKLLPQRFTPCNMCTRIKIFR